MFSERQSATKISSDDENILTHLRLRAKNNLIIGSLNINSLRNKFDELKLLIQGKIDILVVTETKLDSSFPLNQFFIEGFNKPFRFDRNKFGGGVIIYVREDIPCKQLVKYVLPNDIEGLFIEINLRKTKWLLFGTYHPPSQQDYYYFHHLGKAIDFYLKSYEKFVLIGDFNSDESEPHLLDFLNNYNAKNLIHEKTCFKNKDNPSCIDLILTNSSKSFQNTNVMSTGLSDFHKLVLTVINTSFQKMKPKEIVYRDYIKFKIEIFENKLKTSLMTQNNSSYSFFEKTFVEILNKHAPLKKKVIRKNHAPYVTKKMRKCIMKRSQLQNKYFNKRTNTNLKAYKKHKNFCSKLYKKEKKHYYSNLKINKVTDNKLIWKTVKPFMSDKGSSMNQISLIENNKLLVKDEDIAKCFNDYFDTAVSNLEINENNDLLSNVSHLTVPVDIAIAKYENHPSILSIKQPVNATTTFDEIMIEINKLNKRKNGTFGNIPPKLLQQTSYICNEPLMRIWNEELIKNHTFPQELKLADIIPIFKKADATLAKNYRPVSVLPLVSKIFERIMLKQLSLHIDTFLSPFMCGYRKGFSPETALTCLLENWKNALDNKEYAGVILMDLSKAFGCN